MEGVKNLIKENLAPQVKLLEPTYAAYETSLDQMNLYEIYHTNDKIITSLYAKKSDRETLKAAEKMQSFILAHNFLHRDP